ncbi:hypothetical protein ACFLYJ_01580 [Candidatus Cloacimonadota bacterium]
MFKYLVLFLFIIIVISCSIPENLGIPTWTSQIQLYVLNDIYDAVQLAEEDSALVTYGDTLGFFQNMEETTELDFTTEPSTDTDQLEIGELAIDNPDTTYTAVPLNEVAPNLQPGYIAPPGIPPFTMPDVLKDDLEPFDQFQELLFVSGQMQFTLVNNTCIWFGNINDGEPMTIQILDMNDNVILTHQFSEDIPPLAAYIVEESANLAGITMLNEIKVLTTGGSRGSDGEEATVVPAATLDIAVAILDPVAQYAIAQIPQQSITETVYVSLDEDVTMYQTILSDVEQYVTIEITNEIDLEMTATVIIEDMILPSTNEPFEMILNVPASGGSSVNITEVINISGATMGDGITPIDSLRVDVDALTVDTGDDYRTIATGQIFTVETTIDSLSFAYVKGILQPQEQDDISGSSSLDVPYPYINGTFNIVGYSEIEFYFDTPVPALLTVDINAANDDGDVVQLVDLTNGQLPVIEIEQGGSSIILTSDEYNLNEFISVLPDSIWYTISPIVGDPVEIFEFYEGDVIQAEITIESVMDIEADCWLIPENENGEPEVQVIDTEGIEENQLDAFISAFLTLDYINTLGFDTSVQVLFSEQKYTDFDVIAASDTTIFKIIEIPAIMQSTGTTMEQTEIEITRSDLDFFVGDSVFVVPKIQLISEEGIPLSGSIQLQGLMKLEFEVSSELAE